MRTGSVGRYRRVSGSSLTADCVVSLSKAQKIIRGLVHTLSQYRKTRPDMTEILLVGT